MDEDISTLKSGMHSAMYGMHAVIIENLKEKHPEASECYDDERGFSNWNVFVRDTDIPFCHEFAFAYGCKPVVPLVALMELSRKRGMDYLKSVSEIEKWFMLETAYKSTVSEGMTGEDMFGRLTAILNER